MKKKAIKFEYDPEVDAAYLTLRKARVSESEELGPGIVVDFDESNAIVGIEILRFTSRFRRASAGAIKPFRTVQGEPRRRAAG